MRSISPAAASSDGVHAVRPGDDLVTVVFQIEFDALDEQLFVVNYQNFHGLSSTVTKSRMELIGSLANAVDVH